MAGYNAGSIGLFLISHQNSSNGWKMISHQDWSNGWKMTKMYFRQNLCAQVNNTVGEYKTQDFKNTVKPV